MPDTNLPAATDDYVAARAQLRRAELDLADQRERVAELRRALPEGPRVDDYALVEGAEPLRTRADGGRPVRLSELVSAPGRPLIVYHLMFGKRQSSPCPMCTM